MIMTVHRITTNKLKYLVMKTNLNIWDKTVGILVSQIPIGYSITPHTILTITNRMWLNVTKKKNKSGHQQHRLVRIVFSF